jgi:KUP system potassium uptake protein
MRRTGSRSTISARANYRVFVRYKFIEQPDLARALAACGAKGLAFEINRTSCFLSRQLVEPKLALPMSVWRETYFIWMLRNSQSATDYYRIPAECVVELGTLVEI